MKGRVIAAATTVMLIAFATSSDAKPIKVTGSCSHLLPIVLYDAGIAFYQFQTFESTFSTLKSIRLRIFENSGDPEVEYGLTLFEGAPSPSGGFSGLIQKRNVVGYLLAGSTQDDAERGYTVIFTFDGGQTVVPGVTYTFQLYQIDNPLVATFACMSDGMYPDGQLFISSTPQGDEDFDMLITGSGSPNAK